MRIIILITMILSLLLPSLCLAGDTSVKDAYSLYYKGKKQEAIKMMEEYVAENPDPEALYFLGYAYYELKQMDRASGYFNDAYVRRPFYSPAVGDQLVDSLILKSGMNRAIRQFSEQFILGFRQGMTESADAPEGIFERVESAVADSFDDRKMQKTVGVFIKKNLDSSDIEYLLEWFDSPLGRKITMLEEYSDSPEAQAEIQAMSAQLLKDTRRVDMIRRFDAAGQVTETTLDIMINSQIAVVSTLFKVDGTDPRDAVKMVRESREQLRPQVAGLVLASMLYTYRTLDDNELEKYIAFSEAGPSRKFVSSFSDGLEKAVEQGSTKLWGVMGSIAAEIRKQSH